MTSYRKAIEAILPGAKVIKLKGYYNNANYQTAKQPIERWQDAKDPNEKEIASWISQKGWIGAVIPEGFIVIDVDDKRAAEIISSILEDYALSHHMIITPNGRQFVFRAADQEIRQISKFYTSIGVKVDTRISGKGYIVFPTEGTENRFISKQEKGELSQPPSFLVPLRKADKEKHNFSFPIEEVGSRNETLYNFASCLRAWGVNEQEIVESMRIVYEYFLLEKDGFPPRELEAIIRSALKWQPDVREVFSFTIQEGFSIPHPYRIKQGQLFKVVIKKLQGEEIEEERRVSRMAPIILRELTDVETEQKYYEISWKDQNEERQEIVKASTISLKKELLSLADRGLSVNELNYKDMIDYFDRYIASNQIERCQLVERLGHVNGEIIHPLEPGEYLIRAPGGGEKQLLAAFQAKGTIDSWKAEVFDRIKAHPKALFLIFASFASILLDDIEVPPFVVDLSGSTSQGKTTALQAARSVWGKSFLINEWNSTRVSVERKASFLNSFPLYMDDTRKADEKTLQSIVYQFSGGRAKGRGSLVGGQSESTWRNILISTGEVSLSDFAERAGGAVARIISIVDSPFGNVNYIFFQQLYEAIRENYGAIGLEFVRKWKTERVKYVPSFQKVQAFYADKSQGDEALSRMSLFYAAVHFAAAVARDMFLLDVDLDVLSVLFDDIAGNNEGLNKPRELLELILSDLDRSRNDILYDDSVFDITPKAIKAIYHNDLLYLMPAYVKERLGVDSKMIRAEWVKKGYVIPGEGRDTVTVRKGGKVFRAIRLSPAVLEECQYYFGTDQRIIPFSSASKKSNQ